MAGQPPEAGLICLNLTCISLTCLPGATRPVMLLHACLLDSDPQQLSTDQHAFCSVLALLTPSVSALCSYLSHSAQCFNSIPAIPLFQ